SCSIRPHADQLGRLSGTAPASGSPSPSSWFASSNPRCGATAGSPPPCHASHLMRPLQSCHPPGTELGPCALEAAWNRPRSEQSGGREPAPCSDRVGRGEGGRVAQQARFRTFDDAAPRLAARAALVSDMQLDFRTSYETLFLLAELS